MLAALGVWVASLGYGLIWTGASWFIDSSTAPSLAEALGMAGPLIGRRVSNVIPQGPGIPNVGTSGTGPPSVNAYGQPTSPSTSSQYPQGGFNTQVPNPTGTTVGPPGTGFGI